MTPTVESSVAKRLDQLYTQGRPINVKHDATCVMGKVGEDKNPKRGKFKYIVIKILHNSVVGLIIKCCKTDVLSVA